MSNERTVDLRELPEEVCICKEPNAGTAHLFSNPLGNGTGCKGGSSSDGGHAHFGEAVFVLNGFGANKDTRR